MPTYALPPYVGVSVPASHASSGTQTINYPAGVQGGDFLLLALRTPLTATFGDPAGWTPVGGTPVDAANSVRLYLWARKAGGSTGVATTDSGSVTATASVAVVAPGFLIAVRPDQTGGTLTLAQMIDAIAVAADNVTTDANLAVPGYTTTVPNTRVIHGSLLANGGAGGSITGFPGTKRVEDNDGNTATTRSIAVGTDSQATAGVKASINLTDSSAGAFGNDVSVGFVLAIRSAGVVPPNVSTLQDDFDDNSIDAAKWDTTAGVSETGGKLRFVPTSSFPEAKSDNTYSLVGSSLLAETATVPTFTTGTVSWYAIAWVASNTFVGFHWENGTLYMEEQISGVQSRTSVAFNAVTHRWVRVREASGTIYWDTSPDGVTWTTLRTKTAGRVWDDIRALLTSGFTGSEPTPGMWEVSNFNIVPPQYIAAPFCVLPAAKTFTPRAGYANFTGQFRYGITDDVYDIARGLAEGGGVITSTHPGIVERLESMSYAFIES